MSNKKDRKNIKQMSIEVLISYILFCNTTLNFEKLMQIIMEIKKTMIQLHQFDGDMSIIYQLEFHTQKSKNILKCKEICAQIEEQCDHYFKTLIDISEEEITKISKTMIETMVKKEELIKRHSNPTFELELSKTYRQDLFALLILAKGKQISDKTTTNNLVRFLTVTTTYLVQTYDHEKEMCILSI